MNGNVLVMTLAITIEPLPILAGVLLLTTKGGRQKAVALLLGWALALAVIGVIIVVVGSLLSAWALHIGASWAVPVVAFTAVSQPLDFSTGSQVKDPPRNCWPATKRASRFASFIAFVIGMIFSSILPTFTTILPSWWGTYGWFFGVAIGGGIYYALRMGARK